MSEYTKKKYAVEEVLNNYDLPTDQQQIVKIVKSCGNNLHEIVTPSGEQFLVSMPSKYRKSIWIKRGDFVVINPIAEGVRVKGEIAHILLKDQIKYFKSQGVWPKEFSEDKKTDQESGHCDVALFQNPNRPNLPSSSSSSEEEEEKEENAAE